MSLLLPFCCLKPHNGLDGSVRMRRKRPRELWCDKEIALTFYTRRVAVLTVHKDHLLSARGGLRLCIDNRARNLAGKP